MKILVIGQGLAGSLTAWELLQRGVDVCVKDNFSPESSSRIAAGLINPINGTRPRPTWMLDTMLPFAYGAYQKLSEEFGSPLLSHHTIRRVFVTEEDKRLWDLAYNRKWYENSYTGFGVECREIAPSTIDGVNFVHGGVEYAGAALNTNSILNSIKQRVRYADIDEQVEADVTIFCEGWTACSNPLWSWLPFQPVKGEIIDATIDAPFLQGVVTRNYWIVPFEEFENGKQRIRVGSTYDWDDMSAHPTHEALQLLIDNAEQILGRRITVLAHRAAVRPAARSKRPYLGIHPEHKHFGIVNGFGAKGALWAPWAAKQLADHLLNGAELHPEVNINRWWPT